MIGYQEMFLERLQKKKEKEKEKRKTFILNVTNGIYIYNNR